MGIRDINKKKWFWVQNRIMDQYAPEIGPNGVAIYCALARKVDNKTQIVSHINFDDIARLAGVGKSTVQKHLAKLIELGLVEIVEPYQPRKLTNTYRLLDAPERMDIPERIVHRRATTPPGDPFDGGWAICSSGEQEQTIPPDEQVIPSGEQVIPPDEQVVPPDTTLQYSSQYSSQNSITIHSPEGAGKILSAKGDGRGDSEATPKARGKRKKLSPEIDITTDRIVGHFQAGLNARGNPIVFTEEGGLPQQREYAEKLLDLCGGDEAEAKRLINLYLTDPWHVRNKPDLEYLVRNIDKVRAIKLVDKDGHDVSDYAQTWEEL